MIRAVILGYGNLGKAVQQALSAAPDMQLKAIYTRRAAQLRQQPEEHLPGVPFLEPQELTASGREIDIVINCGGSAQDLPRTTAVLSGHFCVADSFDTHAAIAEHYAAVDTAARAGSKLSVISAGWDPGLFSLMRLFGNAFLPDGQTATFWGPGVSQGHSEALRRLPGVIDARQYTIPKENILQDVRNGNTSPPVQLSHKRLCYIVAQPDTDLPFLEKTIRNIPNYFQDYETEIHFISQEEMTKQHGRLPHGGYVICTQSGSDKDTQCMELKLQLSSNPAFTAAVLVACARAAVRLYRCGERGCRTMLDIPPALYLPRDGGSLRASLL